MTDREHEIEVWRLEVNKWVTALQGPIPIPAVTRIDAEADRVVAMRRYQADRLALARRKLAEAEGSVESC